jgi:HPt (histidine-containing phosphotransfer) domain-containing protein
MPLLPLTTRSCVAYPRILSAITKTLGAESRKDLMRAAHALKGSLSYFGTNSTIQVALKLETLGEEGKTQTRLARQKAPLRRQLFGGPIAFHGASPSWNGCCKVGTRSIAFRRMMERRSNSA